MIISLFLRDHSNCYTKWNAISYWSHHSLFCILPLPCDSEEPSKQGSLPSHHAVGHGGKVCLSNWSKNRPGQEESLPWALWVGWVGDICTRREEHHAFVYPLGFLAKSFTYACDPWPSLSLWVLSNVDRICPQKANGVKGKADRWQET